MVALSYSLRYLLHTGNIHISNRLRRDTTDTTQLYLPTHGQPQGQTCPKHVDISNSLTAPALLYININSRILVSEWKKYIGMPGASTKFQKGCICWGLCTRVICGPRRRGDPRSKNMVQGLNQGPHTWQADPELSKRHVIVKHGEQWRYRHTIRAQRKPHYTAYHAVPRRLVCHAGSLTSWIHPIQPARLNFIHKIAHNHGRKRARETGSSVDLGGKQGFV